MMARSTNALQAQTETKLQNEQKISASPPKADICVLMSTRPRSQRPRVRPAKGPAARRFRTFQACPKDLFILIWQVERTGEPAGNSEGHAMDERTIRSAQRKICEPISRLSSTRCRGKQMRAGIVGIAVVVAIGLIW
jgi:hypothetical protein